MPPRWSSRTLTCTVVLTLALMAFHVRSESAFERYGLTQPIHLTEDQWKIKLEEIAAAGRLRNGSSIPWDFKVSGSLWFEGTDTGLVARNRETLAKSMDHLLNLKAPYKDAYCTLTLHITGSVSKDPKTLEIVRRRVASVRLWFTERGYDPTLIRAGAWYGSEPKEVQWELEGGLWSSKPCYLERAKRRRELANVG
jgi:hypothetical protein